MKRIVLMENSYKQYKCKRSKTKNTAIYNLYTHTVSSKDVAEQGTDIKKTEKRKP